MTPAEIAALLALPESARAKLADIAGPGWHAPDANTIVPMFAPNPFRVTDGWAWCPADTFAIVQACGHVPALIASLEGGYVADVWGTGADHASATGETPRLAALRLLATVPA